MKKRILAVLMAAVMTVGLIAGCGNNAGGSSDGDGGDSGTVEITWMHHFQEEGIQKWITDVLAEFEKQEPDIKVTVDLIPQDSFAQTLKTRIASDDAPMIFDLSQTDIIEYSEAGHLADLSDLEGLANLDQTMLPSGQIDGVQYSVPLDMNGYGIFYNKDVFDEYGLEIPTTRSELIAVCETLQENGVQPFAGGFAEQWCLQAFYDAFACQTLGDKNWWTDKMSLESDFSSDEQFRYTVEYLSTLIQYCGDDPFGEDWDTAQSKVANGEAAMTANGAWAIDGILAKNPDCNVRVCAFPATDNPEETVMQKRPGNGFVVYNSEDEAKVEAAKKLVDFLTTKESGELYVNDASKFSIVSGVDLSSSEPLSDIASYDDDHSWVSADVTMFSTEYLSIFYETLARYMLDTPVDADGLCQSLDQDFAAIGG